MAQKCDLQQKTAVLMGVLDTANGTDSSAALAHAPMDARQKYLDAYMKGDKGLDASMGKNPKKTFWEKTQDAVPFLKLRSELSDPATVLGEGFVRQHMDNAARWQAAVVDGKLQNNHEAQRKLWKEMVAPDAQKALDELEGSEVALNALGGKRGAALEYLKDMVEGQEVFGHLENRNMFLDMADNAVSKVVANNPDIFMLNFLEYQRAIGTAGPHRALMGLVKAAAPQKGRKGWIFGEVPELQRHGVYVKPKEEFRFGLIGLSDNFLRTAGYYAGESFGGGTNGGMKTVRKVAFNYQLGNTPRMARKSSYRTPLALMRYTVELYKYLGGAAYNTIAGAGNVGKGVVTLRPGLAGKGAKQAASGAWVLGSWMVMQSMLTGAKTAIPEAIWQVMEQANPDFIEAIEQMDEDDETPFNLVGKKLGLDYRRKSQPGSLAFGIGFDIVNRDVQKAGEKFQAAMDAYNNGDDLEAMLLGGRAMLSMGALTAIPGVGDINSFKLYDIVEEYLRGEIYEDDIWQRLKEKFIPLTDPETMPGVEDREKAAS
jgi:hypothetical protein